MSDTELGKVTKDKFELPQPYAGDAVIVHPEKWVMQREYKTRLLVSFIGKTKGAIGISCSFQNITTEGASKDEALLNLYEKYEHISSVKIHEEIQILL